MGALSWLSHLLRGRRPQRPLAPPQTDDNVEQLHAELDRLAKEAAQHRHEAAKLAQQLAKEQRNSVSRVHGHVVRMNRALTNVDARLATLQGAVIRQSNRTGDLLTRIEQMTWNDGTEKAIFKRLGRLTAGDGPILVGPWTGDVGAELLHWVPFLRWTAGRFHVRPERLHIISAGGKRSWYQDITRQYIELTSCCSEDELESSRGRTSPFRGFDRKVLHRVKQRLGGGRVSVLHPMLIERLFGSLAATEVPLDRILRYIVPRRITPPPPTGLDLPSRYVAAWFPFSQAFPDSPANRAIAADMLASLADEGDVVLLETDPGDRRPMTAGHDRIRSIGHEIPVESRLDIQTAIIAGADACVGSANGLAYVASLCGVRSLTLYSAREFWRPRAEVIDFAMDKVNAATMTELDVSGLPLVASILAAGHEDGRLDPAPVA